MLPSPTGVQNKVVKCKSNVGTHLGTMCFYLVCLKSIVLLKEIKRDYHKLSSSVSTVSTACLNNAHVKAPYHSLEYPKTKEKQGLFL